MSLNAPNAYLKTKVMTASPEQLRLMLYDGAIKYLRQARKAMNEKDYEGVYNAIVRAQKITLELSTSINHDMNPELSSRMVGLYNYIYRRLIDANVERDYTAIDESIKLYEYERETWVMALERLAKENETQATETANAAIDRAKQEGDHSGGTIAKIGPAVSTPNNDTNSTSSFSIQG